MNRALRLSLVLLLAGSMACGDDPPRRDAPPPPGTTTGDGSGAGDDTGSGDDTGDDDPPPPEPPAFAAGFARRNITPVVETWIDSNENGTYDPGEEFTDENGNGTWDPVWLGGFDRNRPATGVHDDIYVVAAVFDDGDSRVAIVTIDTVGWMYEEVADVRAMLPADLGIDRLIMHATHNHGVPDTQGLWGPTQVETGKIPAYMQNVKDKSVEAIAEAVAGLEPATMFIGAAIDKDNDLGVVDVRIPVLIDEKLRLATFRAFDDNAVLGTLVNWGNHVETMAGDNQLITGDFTGYLRDGLSDGRMYDGELRREGIGGVTMFLAGNIGGLMTTLPDEPVVDPYTGDTYIEPVFEKVRAQGYRAADLVQDVIEAGDVVEVEDPDIGIYVSAYNARIDNERFILAEQVGVLRRNTTMDEQGAFYTETEVGLLTIGGLWLATVPGELYPEIALGGVENLPGGDFDIEPVEVPALIPTMQGQINMMVNLANDSVGYIIPKSEWDDEPPFITPGGAYGEVNSLGPDTAPEMHGKLLELINQANSAL